MATTDGPANPGIDFATARQGYHTNAESRRKARDDLSRQLRDKARAEYDYRKQMARHFEIARAKLKMAVVEAEIYAKGKAAGAAFDRDLAGAEARATEHLLDALEREASTLRQLVDWTREES